MQQQLHSIGLQLNLAARRWLIALIVGIALTYALCIIGFWQRSGPQDGDQFLVFHALQYWNASLNGLAKQWTPLMCAGLSMAGEPQIPFMSLSMLLGYATDPLWGVRLGTVLYLLIGARGSYLYSGLLFQQPLQRALASALFVGNGFFFCRLGMGHFDFVPFLVLPLLLYLLHRPVTLRSILSMGALTALVVDGSPVAIIHLMFWVGLYAIALSFTRRRSGPVLLIFASACIAALLDAGYLWPMLQAQSMFPRLNQDRFTSFLSLLWFAVLPLRGKVLPANGNGHELSVYIGPVLTFLVWKYRRCLIDNWPQEITRPLIVVSLLCIVLGMGSLRPLHVPVTLSLFDLLRTLPGFRSIGVTGRFWGFLALPMSLASTAALWWYATERPTPPRWHAIMAAALIFQLGFQLETLTAQWLHSPRYVLSTNVDPRMRAEERIDQVTVPAGRFQGQYIAPNRAVANCYDMDDFNRVRPGQDRTLGSVRFDTWNSMRARWPDSIHSAEDPLNLPQAYHPLWGSPGCTTSAGARGQLVLHCDSWTVPDAARILTFDDPVSDLGMRVSLLAWLCWVALVTVPLAARCRSTIIGLTQFAADRSKMLSGHELKKRRCSLSRVLIADDHAVVRAGYKQFLEADPSVTAVGEVASGNAALDELRRQKWDLLLLDIHMPDRGGLDVLAHVRASFPEVKVLVMSGLPEDQYARNVLRAGASGYLPKGSEPDELMKAVRTVLAGRRYVSAALAEIMASDLNNEDDKPVHERLSTREFQIFCKVAGGASISGIAEELSLSVKTVSTYRSRILEKLSFQSNADITAYALRNGLIQ